MGTAAKLDGVPETDSTDLVSVFLPEEGHCPHCLGLGDRYIAELLTGKVGADQAVDHPFHLTEPVSRNLLVVGEVEAEVGRADIRALLLDVGAEDRAQGIMKQMGRRVIVGRFLTFLSIHHSMETCLRLRRYALGYMDAQVVFLDGIDNIGFLP